MTNKFSTYADSLHAAMVNVDQTSLDKAQQLIYRAMFNGMNIYSCGNGGSAAISDHLVCDCVKGIACDTDLYPKIVSLPSNGPLMTAIANDIGYEFVFSKQLEWSAGMSDVLIAISSSGTSKNIVNAIEMAKNMHMKVISIVGFTGGPCKELSDACIHIPSSNYGIVEDASQAVMHYLSQEIRKLHTHKSPEELVL